MAGGSDGQQRFSAKKDAYTDRSGDVVFPAHAGMIPQVWPSVVLKSSVPRTRGDDPSWHDLIDKPNQCSPHTRG